MKRKQNRDKNLRRSRRVQPGFSGEYNPFAATPEVIQDYSPQKASKPLQAKNQSQGHYICGIDSNSIVFGIGPAGCGKTYIAAAYAAEQLESGKIERIIVTRPAIGVDGEDLGALPGELDEKYDPWLAPVLDALEERLGKGRVKMYRKSGRIVGAPLMLIRGKTFNDSIIILDEAQNTTPGQMKACLTRIGNGSKMVVTGDIGQSDIRGANGLEDAQHKLRGVRGVYVHEFTREDCVRSGICGRVLDAYEA